MEGGEPAAVQSRLHVSLGVLRPVPADLQQAVLLVDVERQTCTGHGELQDEGHRQDHHVEEEQDLVVLQCAAQPHEGDQEQDDAHSDDAGHHLDAGHQAEPFAPRSNSHQQQADQLGAAEGGGWKGTVGRGEGLPLTSLLALAELLSGAVSEANAISQDG